MRRNSSCSVMAFAVLTMVIFAGADWTRFRGPNGSGISEDTGLPSEWSATSNVVWKTALPGPGGSCPITLGDKIFVTAYSGYGVNKDKSEKPEDLKRHLLCLDRKTGKVIWDKSAKASLPERDYGGFLVTHGYASSTPVSDGNTVYVFYGRSGVYAYSLAGDELWHSDVGSNTHEWGSGASPILAGNLLVINASIESQAIVALDKTTGKEAWRVAAMKQTWGTPALLQLPNGKQELVASSHSKVFGLDPVTGKQLWTCTGVPDYICPSIIAHNDVAYVTGGRKAYTAAIRGGGQGDVTKSHRLWEIKKTSRIPTPVYHDGRLYWVSDSGIACCVNAEDGKVIYESRIPLGSVYASVVLADGKLYAVSREKGAVVLAVGPEFKELGRGTLDDTSVFNATPTISNGQLLLRSDRFLYCIGK